MKNFKIFLITILLSGLFVTQSTVSAQAMKKPINTIWTWDCYCVGEKLVAHLEGNIVMNANGEHWNLKGYAEGFSFENGEPTGHVFEIRDIENYAYKLRNNGSYNPDKMVMTMQIRYEGKQVALTHRSYEILYDEDGNMTDIVWGGFFCSPQ